MLAVNTKTEVSGWQICNLQYSFEFLNNKYATAQNQIGEYTLALDVLPELGKYNTERFTYLANCKSCKQASSTYSDAPAPPPACASSERVLQQQTCVRADNADSASLSHTLSSYV